MKRNLGEQVSVTDSLLLHELFLQRLPTNVQMVLAAAPTTDLDALANLADSAMEVSSPSVANFAGASSSSSSAALPGCSGANTVVSPTPESRSLAIDQLCQRLEDTLNGTHHFRARSPGQSRQRRSPSRRTRAIWPRSPNQPGICYYHRRFRVDARHCLRTCAWQGNRPADL